MKVLIINARSWYADKIGEVHKAVQVLGSDRFTLIESTFNVLKQDCHVIEPTWKVMQEAKETGRKVEVWSGFRKKFENKHVEGWYVNEIYRLKPEPPKLEIEPLDDNQLFGLFGQVVVKKQDNSTYIITGHKPKDGVVRINDGWYDAASLLELFTINGLPIGKGVSNELERN